MRAQPLSPRSSRSPRTPVTRYALAATLALLACGPKARRDLSTVPQRQVTYDDLCGMQSHFDRVARMRTRHVPTVVMEQSTETEARERDEHGQMQRVLLGEGTYHLTTALLRRRFLQLLRDEYEGLPADVLRVGSEPVRVHLGWWSSGGVRRVRPDEPIEVTANGATVRLPFNPCVGEFLFGAEVYALRRTVLEREDRRARGEALDEPTSSGASAAADAGAPASTDAASPSGDGAAVPDASTSRP